MAVLGFAGDFQYLFVHGNALQTSNHLLHSAFKISAVWGYCMLALNAALTGAIIGKILHAARRVAQQSSCEYNGQQYMLIVEAVIESALVNFLGILLYEIATFAPTGNVEVTFGVGYVFFCILPIFFGISQCLITVRLCLLEKHPSRTPSARRIPIGRTLESSISGRSLRTLPDDLEIPRITFAVHGHEYCRYGLCVAKNTDNMLPCPMAFDDPKRGPF
ncbi:hypothetical protein BDW22DRAFT_1034973 [Trametopsis cervina]|nr:hypothetical protein BDW22DRAFT_1034973 [Trametopsis cervina]